MKATVSENNKRILSLLSEYLNFMPDAITPELIRETCRECSVSEEEAFRILFCGICDIYGDKELRRGWISKMFYRLSMEVYERDPYRQTVDFPCVKDGEWELYYGSYKPYEAFVYDDIRTDGEGRLLPSIGFFDREYTFPAVRQGGREWMLITPNEIETMREPIERAFGNVATYGLGLGYFAFMAARKESVESVTVVERDPSVIRLFEKHILPSLPCRDKIRLVLADAFEYAESNNRHDYVFADIWHDPSDGCRAYLRLKSLEREGTVYSYWIEKTLRLYL